MNDFFPLFLFPFISLKQTYLNSNSSRLPYFCEHSSRIYIHVYLRYIIPHYITLRTTSIQTRRKKTPWHSPPNRSIPCPSEILRQEVPGWFVSDIIIRTTNAAPFPPESSGLDLPDTAKIRFDWTWPATDRWCRDPPTFEIFSFIKNSNL